MKRRGFLTILSAASSGGIARARFATFEPTEFCGPLIVQAQMYLDVVKD